MGDISVIEAANRIKEFFAAIRWQIENQAEKFTSKEFLEIHWVVGEAVEIEEKIKEILVERTESNLADESPELA